MKRWLKILVTLGTLLMAFGWVQQTETAHAESVGYSVSAVLPKNQDDKKVTYFALRVKPKQQQKLTIVIRNTSKSMKRYQGHLQQGQHPKGQRHGEEYQACLRLLHHASRQDRRDDLGWGLRQAIDR
jgi:hypothetical protein